MYDLLIPSFAATSRCVIGAHLPSPYLIDIICFSRRSRLVRMNSIARSVFILVSISSAIVSSTRIISIYVRGFPSRSVSIVSFMDTSYAFFFCERKYMSISFCMHFAL